MPQNNKPPTPYSPPFSPNFSDQELSAWLGEKNITEDINFDELDFEFNNNFESTTSTTHQDSPPVFSISMEAKELIKNCQGLGLKGVSNCSITPDGAPPPSVPELPRVSSLFI